MGKQRLGEDRKTVCNFVTIALARKKKTNKNTGPVEKIC